MDIIKEGIGALIGTLGFSLLFGLQYKRLLASSAGGVFVWLIFASIRFLMPYNDFLCNFIPAIFGTAYSQVMAKVLKVPSTMFIFTSLIVLVPGGKLYYTMSNIIHGNFSSAISYALDTLEIAVAIAFGIVIIMVITKVITYIINKRNREKKHEKGL